MSDPIHWPSMIVGGLSGALGALLGCKLAFDHWFGKFMADLPTKDQVEELRRVMRGRL